MDRKIKLCYTKREENSPGKEAYTMTKTRKKLLAVLLPVGVLVLAGAIGEILGQIQVR